MFRVEAAPRFNRIAKKLPPNVKKVLDEEVRRLAVDPYKGDQKRGALRGVLVEKFEAVNDQWLLAYRVREDDNVVQLLTIGQHENFYRDLNRSLR